MSGKAIMTMAERAAIAASVHNQTEEERRKVALWLRAVAERTCKADANKILQQVGKTASLGALKRGDFGRVVSACRNVVDAIDGRRALARARERAARQARDRADKIVARAVSEAVAKIEAAEERFQAACEPARRARDEALAKADRTLAEAERAYDEAIERRDSAATSLKAALNAERAVWHEPNGPELWPTANAATTRAKRIAGEAEEAAEGAGRAYRRAYANYQQARADAFDRYVAAIRESVQ